MRPNVKKYAGILKSAAVDWWEDKAPRLGAALAYYSLFSLAPLLVLSTAIAGIALGREAVEGRLVGELSSLVGREAGEALQAMIANARKPASSTIATIIGIGVLLVGASGVFGELQDALNTIWEVKPKKGGGFKGFLKERFLSFAMVLVIGFLLLTSLVISTVLSAVGEWVSSSIDPSFAILWQGVNIVVSLAVITGLFALIFKFLPDAKIAWGDVWFGSLITSALFAIGKLGISFYLAHSTVASVYGAAGSLVVILIWLYYSSQILFFGAEITQAQQCLRTGCRPQPKPNAIRVQQADPDQLPVDPDRPARRPLQPSTSHGTR